MLINNSKKIVIKLGSSTVIDKKGNFKKNWVNSLIKDIKRYKKNRDIVIVSSGAIAIGQNYLKIKKNISRKNCVLMPLIALKKLNIDE
jgi:glutamate 5-kinase